MKCQSLFGESIHIFTKHKIIILLYITMARTSPTHPDTPAKVPRRPKRPLKLFKPAVLNFDTALEFNPDLFDEDEEVVSVDPANTVAYNRWVKHVTSKRGTLHVVPIDARFHGSFDITDHGNAAMDRVMGGNSVTDLTLS
jgi:hypothetical protein